MDHFVKLDRLPEGLEFPPQLKDRIHFDPVARKLVFRGYMSKTDFDRLCQLSNDWKFRRTLEELFRSPSRKRSLGPRDSSLPGRRHTAVVPG